MKKFNKYKALTKLDKKNNKNTKRNAIITSVIILMLAILYFSFARFEASKTYSLISGNINFKSQTPIVKKIKMLAANGSQDLEYDGIDTLGDLGTEDNNLRYVGTNPNNYIYFNCSTTDPSQMNDSTCEKWRIIGVFNNLKNYINGEGYYSSYVRIIRDESLGNYSWDYSNSSVNNGKGVNQWGATSSAVGAELMRELNYEYNNYAHDYITVEDDKWYGDNGQLKQMPTKILNSNSSKMLEQVEWRIGSNDLVESSKFTTKKMYDWEKSENSSKACSNGDYCNDTKERKNVEYDFLGLISASDYGYSTKGGSNTNKIECLNSSLYNWNNNSLADCKNYSWLYNSSYSQWTINALADATYATNAFTISSNGSIEPKYASESFAVRPTTHLKKDVAIVSGNGSSSNPYKLIQPENIIDRMKTLEENEYSGIAYDGEERLGESGTTDNNLRYVGYDVYNYVYFNCTTTEISEMNDSTCEKWRIIGAMNNIEDDEGVSETRVKLIRSESLGLYAWDTSEHNEYGGHGINQWGNTSNYEGSDIMRELNTDYLGNITVGTDGKWFGWYDNRKNDMPTTILSEYAQNMIQDVKWDVGAMPKEAFDYDNEESTDYWKINNIYMSERSNNLGIFCNSGNVCNNIERTSNWVGKVALPYISDHFYSFNEYENIKNSVCFSMSVYEWNDDTEYAGCQYNNWMAPTGSGLEHWTITPAQADEYNLVIKMSTKITPLVYYASNYGEIYPTVYLKSDIFIVDGDGSIFLPYKLALK